jgi:predicted amidohydrolase
MTRSNLLAFGACLLLTAWNWSLRGAEEPTAPLKEIGASGSPATSAHAPAKADQPPRKVIVGTTIFGPYGAYPGLAERLRELGDLVDQMGAEASRRYEGKGLDLAILPETTASSLKGPARARALRLEGKVQQAFAEVARRNHCYVLLPLDMVDAGAPEACFSNAAVLFDRSGEVVGAYRKAHPVAYVGSSELEGGITPGRDFPVFDCDFGRLGVQICWDIQFAEGWDELARRGAEIVAWPTASPATALPAARAAQHRYFVVSSTWRDNATVYEPTGMVAARIRKPSHVLVHEIDLSHAILGWSSFLKEGNALKEKYGDRVGYHYDREEDMGLFWSNDPGLTIGAMVRSIGGEELDAQVERNRRLYGESGARRPESASSESAPSALK